MKASIRFSASQFRQIRTALSSDLSAEDACFAFCTQATGSDGPILIVQELRFLNEDDYAVRRFDQLSIEPATMLAVARAAARGNRSICMMHIHPMSRGEVQFSMADDIGDARTHPFFARMVPSAPHVSLVFDSSFEAVEGRASGLGSGWQPVEVTVSGSPGPASGRGTDTSSQNETRYDRQGRLLGEGGQRRLSKLSIVLVGAGGLGSLISAGLVHSGVGSVLVIDSDRADETSLHRLFGAINDDGRDETDKVHIAARYAAALDPNLPFNIFNGVVEDVEILPSLLQTDAIICCTDTTRSRAYLNQLCFQYSVPLLDIGCQFQVEEGSGRLVNEIGKINLVTPESACLMCSGHVRPELMYAESLSDEERHELVEQGYVRGLAGPQPSMQMYNMQVAGLGLQRLLNHLLGVQRVPVEHYERLSFLGVGGRPYWTQVAKRRDPDCIICGERSPVRAAGDSQALYVRESVAA